MGLIETKDYTILSQLYDDFKNKYNDGSRTDLRDFKVGNWATEDMKLMPSICINAYNTTIDQKLMGGSYIKELEIDITIFNRYNPSYEYDWENIYKIKEDVENFLKSDENTYKSGINIYDEQPVYIGSVSDPYALARISFSMKYKDIN